MGLLFVIVYVLVFVLWLFFWSRIFKRMGYPSYYCIVMIIPFVNFIALGILALVKWPTQKREKEL